MILTKSLQNWMEIGWTGPTTSENIPKNTWITSGKICTQKVTEDPLLSQMTATFGISIIQTKKNLKAGGYRLIMMRWAMMAEGLLHGVIEEEMEMDEEG